MLFAPDGVCLFVLVFCISRDCNISYHSLTARNGESKLGKVPFKKAYDFLKKMRYGDDNSVTVDESHIMAQLRQITPNISDCFIIDQLLFLEKQADIDKNS